MSSAPASVERPYGWVIALASLVIMCIGMGASYLSVVALKPIAEEFGWPRAVPSLCYSLAILGMGVGGMIMGRVADRIGVATPALLGATMIAFGAWLASTSNSALQLYVAHGLFIGMLGNGALFAPLIANVTRWFDRRRGIAVSLVASGQHLAGAVWPPIHGALTTAHGWRAAFVVYAVVALVGLVPLCLLLRPPAPALPQGGGRRAGREAPLVLGLHPGLVQAMLCAAIVGCCVAMAMPLVHVIAHATDLGHAPAAAAGMLSVLLACGFVSRLLFGLIVDRIGGLRTLLIGAAGQALTLGLFTVVDGAAGLYLAAAAFGLAFGGIVPCYAIIVRELFPAGEAGWRMGMVFFFGTVGMAAGGWLGGLIFDLAGGYRAAFLVGIVFNLGNLLLVGALNHRQHRARLAPA